MKKIRHILAFLLSVALIVSCTACSGGSVTSSQGETTGSDTESADGTESMSNGDTESTGSESINTESTTVESADTGNSSGGNTTAATTSKVSTATAKPKATKNLNGRTIGIYATDSYFPTTQKGTEKEKMTQHFAELEKNFNCKIKQIKTSTEFSAAIAAGAYYADIALFPSYRLKPYIRSGWIKDLGALGLDTNQEKFVDSYKKSIKYDNKYYGLNFSSWYNQIMVYDQCLLYNKTALEKLKLPDPQKLANQGKWTVSAFRAIAKKFAAQGKGYYGSTAGNLWQEFVWASGGRAVSWDAKANKWVFGYKNNSKVYDALDNAIEYLHRDANYLPIQSDWTYNSYEVFNKGKSAFILAEINWIMYGFYNDMEDDYAMVPFPTEDGTISAVGRLEYNVYHWAIPQNVKNPKDIALFFDAFSEPLPGTNVNSWESYMLENIWRGNTESLKWYKQMLNNAEDSRLSDIGNDNAAILLTTLSDVVNKRSMTGAEAIESLNSKMQAYIDEAINNDPKVKLPH